MPSRTQPISLDLAGFTWPELMVLAHHLQYAADRLWQEMDHLRQTQHKPYLYPGKAGKTKSQPPGLMISHWAGLIRDHRYFTVLAQAVEAVLDDRWGTLFISDYLLPPLDLSGLQAGTNQYFIVFLNRELYRARLAVAYLQKETFDEQVKQDLLLALNVEIRFFCLLLDQIGRLCSPYPAAAVWPEEDRVPLLFVSLPRILTTGYTRTTPLSVGQAA